jgi:pimeloyl-ACP methyl ester carboxylesterase
VVVLLHGQPGTSADWSQVVDRLAGRFRVLAPDRPGYGRTGGQAGDFDTNSAAVVAHLDASGVSRAVIVGHSWGGGVALRVAQLAPERVAGLVLAASIGAEPPGRFDRLLAVRPVGEAVSAAALGGTAWALSLGVVRRRLRDRLPPSRSCALEALLCPGPDGAALRSSAWRSFAVEQRAFVAGAGGLRDALGALDCPVEVVTGSADRVVKPNESRRLADAIPGAHLVVVPGVGHLLPQDAPAVLAGSVTDVALRSGLLGARGAPDRPEARSPRDR